MVIENSPQDRDRALPALDVDRIEDREQVLIIQPADLPKKELMTFIEVAAGAALPSLGRMNKRDLARLFTALFV